ncbi:FDXHR family putative zinc-binding protein, partial [Frankia gtarii]|uniref:FDXHR family putative zinc-binding protein n=2 Tax=Frankia gtarii TaxID=2950102 RepID=UPI0027DFFADF
FMAGRDIEYERPILLGCGGCDARWTALTAAHCPGCHATFAGATTGFDAHRVNGVCQPPQQVGLRHDRGYWLVAGEKPPGRVLHRSGEVAGGRGDPGGSAGPSGGEVRMAG